MHEVVDEGTRLWEQITTEGLLSLGLSDVVWLMGALCLLILALKLARKIWKVLLVLIAVVLLLLWLAGQGVI